MTACTRGCTPPAIASAVLCQRCADKLLGHLTGIWAAYEQLDTSLAARTGNDGIKRGKVTGSPALLRLDVLALQDPNTRWDGTRGELRYVPGELEKWRRRLCDTLGVNVGSMTAWFGELIKQPWAAQMLDELNDLAGVLARANGERRRAVGHCLTIVEHEGLYETCERALYATVGSDVVQCNACGRRYVGSDLLRVKLMEGAGA